MRLLFRITFTCLLLLIATGPVRAAGTIGIVLLHGKTGTPNQFAKLAAALKAAGYGVATPEMCWSKTRIFDKAFNDCLDEVDAAAAKLKAAGDSEIVVGGTSQGAIGALAYGAAHSGLAGVVAMAPAGDPNDDSAYPKFAQSIADARALVQAGKGDAPATFADLISGGNYVTVHATAKAFLSFHDPDSPAATVRNLMRTTLPNLNAPVLWVVGTQDPSQKGTPKAFAAIPKQAKSRYVTIDADHGGTPDASAEVIIAWLKTLP